MTEKRTDRPIDRIRNSAGSFTVGDPGEVPEAMITTTDHLYTVTKLAIYAVQLADQIDPERTNIALPQVFEQKILGYGADSDFVARTFMTGGELFNRTYLGSAFPVDTAKKLALELAKRLAVLQDTLGALVANEQRAIDSLNSATGRNSFRIPETADLRTKVETFMAAADRIQETLFALAHLFYPKPQGQLDTRAHLIASVERATPGRTDFHTAIRGIVGLLHEVREHRNASAHQDGQKSLLIRDFHMLPSGELSAPVMEIRHPTFALPETPVTHYMLGRVGHLTEVSEAMIAWLCAENIKAHTGPLFQHEVAILPEGERRSGSRFYYHTALTGPLPEPPPTSVAD